MKSQLHLNLVTLTLRPFADASDEGRWNAIVSVSSEFDGDGGVQVQRSSRNYNNEWHLE